MDNQVIKNVLVEVDKPKKVIYGRRDYFWGMFSVWFVLPILASIIILYFRIDLGGVEGKVKLYESGKITKGFQFNLLSMWYLQVTIHIYICYKRVSDTGLNKWFTALFCLPVINFILLLWPSKKI